MCRTSSATNMVAMTTDNASTTTDGPPPPGAEGPPPPPTSEAPPPPPGGEGAPPPQRPPGYPPLHTLRRSRSDRKVAGVAGGLGRHTGIDPLVFRILFVVLTVFGGSGLLFYALGWLLVPDEGETDSEAARLAGGRRDGSTIAAVVIGVVALCLGLILIGNLVDTGPGLGGLGVLVVVVALVLLFARSGPSTAPSQAAAPPYGPVPPPEPGAYGQTPGTAYAATATHAPETATGPVPPPPAPPTYGPPVPPQQPPPPPKPPKERSYLGRLTVSAALIVVGLMVGWNSASDDDIRAVAILAAALAVVAAGLVVGAFMGRARWLIAIAIPLTLATSATAVADEHLPGGVGERDWAPASVMRAERGYELAIGEGQLDLTRLPAGSTADIDARVGFGELRVIVPRDATVHVDGHVAAGVVRAQGHPTLEDDDLDASYTFEPVAGTQPTGTVITVDADVVFGELEVRRATS